MSRPAAALGFAARRGLVAVRRRAGATAWAAAAVAAALFVLGATRLVEHNLVGLTGRWPGGIDMVVYLDDGVAPARADALAAALAALPAVERVEAVPPAAALERLRRALGDEAAALDGVEPGLVPASIEVALEPGIDDVVASHPVIERLRAAPGVEDVEFVGDWVERADALAAGLRSGGSHAAWLATILAVVLTAAAVRLAVAGRRREARVLDLLGATAAFQRGPAVVHGLVTGLAGAALACLALALGYREAAGPIAAALGASLGGGEVAFLPGGELILLIATGAVLGAAGGFVAGPSPGETRA